MLNKPFLTVHDAAALLRVKEATLRNWIRQKQIRAIKFGREWRISEEDLANFVNSRANRED